jgi:hypothetical protein
MTAGEAAGIAIGWLPRPGRGSLPAATAPPPDNMTPWLVHARARSHVPSRQACASGAQDAD